MARVFDIRERDLEAYFATDAIRSTTESRCAGERWLYRADIVIVLWPAAS